MSAILQLATNTAGHRSVSRADLWNDELVERYEALEEKPSRRDAQNALKKIRPAFKGVITETAFALLDRLVELSFDQDWNGGPILVWPSNQTLANYLMRSTRTVQACLRALKENNFITYKDRPNRNRAGNRDANLRLVGDCTGIDLRPLAARTSEFMKMAEQIAAEEKETRRLKRSIGAQLPRLAQFIARGSAAAPDSKWTAFATRLDEIEALICARAVTLEDLQAADELLQPLAEQIYDAANEALQPAPPETPKAEIKVSGISPRGEAGFTQKTTTTPLSPEGRLHVEPPKRGVVKAVPAKPAPEGDAEPAEPKVSWSAARAHLEKYKVTPAMLMTACPSFFAVDEAGLDPDAASWADLAELAQINRHLLGIHVTAWDELITSLGHAPAVVAIAVVCEKTMRGLEGKAEPVASPGGYVRWLARAPQRTGALDLGPKVHALLGKKVE